MCMYIRIHEYAHVLHTHTHTNGHRRTSTHTIIHTSKHIYAKAHASMCPHPRIYPRTSIHAHIFARAHIHTYPHTPTHTHTYTLTCTRAQALTHTCARALTYIRAYKTKMYSQTLRTTHIHTQIHSYANTRPWTCVSTHNLLTNIRAYTGALTFMWACARP